MLTVDIKKTLKKVQTKIYIHTNATLTMHTEKHNSNGWQQSQETFYISRTFWQKWDNREVIWRWWSSFALRHEEYVSDGKMDEFLIWVVEYSNPVMHALTLSNIYNVCIIPFMIFLLFSWFSLSSQKYHIISLGIWLISTPLSPSPDWVATRQGNSSHIRTGTMQELTTPPQRWGQGA